MNRPGPEGTPTPAPPARGKIRDVADFHRRWAEFRPYAEAAGRNPGLDAAEVETIHWMMALMDRIGPRDLEDE